MRRSFLLAVLPLWPLMVMAQLAVTVSNVKATGEKAIVPLVMKNNFTEKIESACAVCFLLDEQGKVIGQATRWVIGGSQDKPGLAAGATNAFHFVIAAEKPFPTTNLAAKVAFSRLVLEGGRQADPMKDARVSVRDDADTSGRDGETK